MEVALEGLIRSSVEDSRRQLRRLAPALAEKVEPWMDSLALSGRAADYFGHIRRYPVFQLPWWAGRGFGMEEDAPLLRDLTRSTVDGYYYIRLLDNVMDGNMTVEADLLPVAGYFHSRFQQGYHTYFAAGDPFWEYFERVWTEAAQATVLDAGLTEVDRKAFVEISSRKLGAAMIPLAAVCLYAGRADLIPAWERFCGRLACHVQMSDDLFDWNQDLRQGQSTWLLSEAGRRCPNTRPLEGWILEDGFSWAAEKLRRWTRELIELAAPLEAGSLTDYVHRRQREIEEAINDSQDGRRALAALARGMGG